jgi:phosphoglycolate phosphatase-like HAD superfamily hydrolase
MMIGDGMQDLGVARAAGSRFAAFLGGMGDPRALEQERPDYTIRDFGQLSILLSGMEPAARD